MKVFDYRIGSNGAEDFPEYDDSMPVDEYAKNAGYVYCSVYSGDSVSIRVYSNDNDDGDFLVFEEIVGVDYRWVRLCDVETLFDYLTKRATLFLLPSQEEGVER